MYLLSESRFVSKINSSTTGLKSWAIVNTEIIQMKKGNRIAFILFKLIKSSYLLRDNDKWTWVVYGG